MGLLDGTPDREEPESEPEPNPHTGESFMLASDDLTFGPYHPAQNVAISKDRNLNRKDSVCDGESVSDSGGKNREVTITGLIRDSERLIYEDVLDYEKPLELKTLGWSGEVRVSSGKYRGPIGYDSHTKDRLWRYTLTVVSTGKDEYENHAGDGILDDNPNPTQPDPIESNTRANSSTVGFTE